MMEIINKKVDARAKIENKTMSDISLLGLRQAKRRSFSCFFSWLFAPWLYIILYTYSYTDHSLLVNLDKIKYLLIC